MRAIVIGAGPSGLACAACLKRKGMEVVTLERAEHVGSSWHGHYKSLHLHTARGRSGLPFHPMPRRYGRYPGREQVIEYLQNYCEAERLQPQFGTEVSAIRPAETGWNVSHLQGTESADAVILATGLSGQSFRPDIEGAGTFPGPILHSSDYKTASEFKEKHVLVVGFGNSGGDIGLDLSRTSAKVTIAVRGPVNILPKELFGIPITSMGGLRKIMPYTWADALTAPVLRAKIGRAEDYGLQSAGKGPAAQVIEDGRIPLIDTGTLQAIRSGNITVRPGIERIDGAQVQFVDGGSDGFDAIILATGYRTDLRPLLPDTPQALDATGNPLVSGAPSTVSGLYFCSYHASADGQLRQSGIEARAIAEHLARPAT